MDSTHDYTKYAASYATLELEGVYFLAFRDLPFLLETYVKGTRALDYGCGGGRSTRFLKSLRYNTTGVDISADMLRQAKERDESGDYQLVETAKVPFDDETFDVVFSSFVFMEVATIEEISAILDEKKKPTTSLYVYERTMS